MLERANRWLDRPAAPFVAWAAILAFGLAIEWLDGPDEPLVARAQVRLNANVSSRGVSPTIPAGEGRSRVLALPGLPASLCAGANAAENYTRCHALATGDANAP